MSGRELLKTFCVYFFFIVANRNVQEGTPVCRASNSIEPMIKSKHIDIRVSI